VPNIFLKISGDLEFGGIIPLISPKLWYSLRFKI
jgi:hypothetical protein